MTRVRVWGGRREESRRGSAKSGRGGGASVRSLELAVAGGSR
jgi:hypothetical protein